MKESPHAIVLFDGVCHLCNASVNFIIDRDPDGYFRFASQQSPAGQTLLHQYGLSREELQTIVLIQDGRSYARSEAVLRIAMHLRGAIRLFALAIAIPSLVRDVVYDFVARNRYRWFGRMEACRMPSPEIVARFVK